MFSGGKKGVYKVFILKTSIWILSINKKMK